MEYKNIIEYNQAVKDIDERVRQANNKQKELQKIQFLHHGIVTSKNGNIGKYMDDTWYVLTPTKKFEFKNGTLQYHLISGHPADVIDFVIETYPEPITDF